MSWKTVTKVTNNGRVSKYERQRIQFRYQHQTSVRLVGVMKLQNVIILIQQSQNFKLGHKEVFLSLVASEDEVGGKSLARLFLYYSSDDTLSASAKRKVIKWLSVII